LPYSSRSHRVQRTRTLRIHRVGENICRRRLDQEGRMTDERDDGRGSVEGRRRLRYDVEMRRPGRPRLAQHLRHRGEWLLRRLAGRIVKPPAVEMIGHLLILSDEVEASGHRDTEILLVSVPLWQFPAPSREPSSPMTCAPD